MVTEVIGGVSSLILCLRLLGSKRFDRALLIDLSLSATGSWKLETKEMERKQLDRMRGGTKTLFVPSNCTFR